jgi:precorrin-6A synthase
MRRLAVVGIGAGDPEHITVQAIRALNRAEVVFVVEKGSVADELAEVRREILARYVDRRPGPRVVAIADPERERGATDYGEAVERWRRRRADVWEAAIAYELPEGGCGAFLVWGDPALYDSTTAVLEHVLARGRLELAYEVIPGISSLQALAARHRVSWTRVGGAVQITTGRRLAQGLPSEADDVLVMLDSGCTFERFAGGRDEGSDGGELEIYWGAYVGTDDEILLSGPLDEVAGEIARRRAEARARKGWIMDSYLLRRPPRRPPPQPS